MRTQSGKPSVFADDFASILPTYRMFEETLLQLRCSLHADAASNGPQPLPSARLASETTSETSDQTWIFKQ